jgi:hypothetical protein
MAEKEVCPLLLLGAMLVGIELTPDDESLLTPQVYGGMMSSNGLQVTLASSHGKPGRCHEMILAWAKIVAWEPGIYVECDPESPYSTGLDVMLIANNT